MERHSISTEAVHAARACSPRSPTRRTRSSRRPSTRSWRWIRSRKRRRAVYRDARRGAAARERRRLRRPARAARAHAAAESGAARSSIAQRFQYILVDEYQDTNRAQYELVKLLGGEHGNVCVVGDDDQSIYGWRGADIRNILDFNKDFPTATSCGSRRTIARTPQILDLANAVISANTGRMGKTLRATRAAGERVTARARARRARRGRLRRRGADRRGARATTLELRDFAVLYRTNAQSRALEEALRRQRDSVPARRRGALLRSARDPRPDELSQAHRESRGRRGVSPRRRRAAARPRRHDASSMLAEASREAGMPMFDGRARATSSSTACARRRARALAEFVALIARLARARRGSGGRRAAARARRGDPLRRLPAAPRGRSRRSGSRTCSELITGAAELVADELGEVGLTPLDHFLQRATLVAERRRARTPTPTPSR